MSNIDPVKAFWAKQSSSLSPDNRDAYYHGKAEEHASLISPEDRSAGIVDLGCGAGELLAQFVEYVKVEAGLDFADSMLAEARKRLLHHPEIMLVSADLFAYLPEHRHRVWTTTGAINQYLNEADTRRFLELFKTHSDAHALYLFDCIDPLRYALQPYGLSYRPQQLEQAQARTLRQRIGRPIRLAQLALRFARGGFSQDFQYLGSPGMGYGAAPRFWLRAARDLGLRVQIVSSRYFEYRYHVMLHKA